MKKTDVLFGSATVCKRAIGQKYQLTINCGGFSSKSSEECHELHIELALKKTLKQVYQSAFMANCGAMTVWQVTIATKHFRAHFTKLLKIAK